MNKRILILYATAGVGHKKAAEALYNEAVSRSLNVHRLDIITFMPRFFQWAYDKGYALLITRFPKAWGVVYYLSNAPFLSLLNVHLRRFLNALTCSKLIKYLNENKYDIIVSTHFLASEIVSYAKQENKLKSRLITVVTDFGVHNFWLAPNTDHYCCASETTKQILMQKGVPEYRISITGIPIDNKFLTTARDDKTYEHFNLDKNKFTALIMTGGVGAGPIEEIVDALKDDIQLLVVCGNNSELYDKLFSKLSPNMRIFKFVDFVHKLMSISDVIITKAGGLTVSESLTMKLPMVFFYILEGQEMINAKTMQDLQIGILAPEPKKVREAVLNFKNSPQALADFKKRAELLSKPKSSSEILDLFQSY